MDYDENKIDEMTLALLYLTAHGEEALGKRAWKGHDWEALNRLHEKGLIGDPKSKAKSVAFTEEGYNEAKALFQKTFTKE